MKICQSLSSYENNVEDFLLKHLLLFEICAREICERFVYKHSETIEYVKTPFTFWDMHMWDMWRVCREICERFAYKHSETIEYVKN